MPTRLELRANGRLGYDIRTRGPDGVSIRERRELPDGVTGRHAGQRWANDRAKWLAVHGDGPAPTVVQVPTLATFAPRWLLEYAQANGNKPSTLDTKDRILRLHLLPVLGRLTLDQIGSAELQRVKLAMGKAAPKTIGCVLAQLATMLGSAKDWKLIATVPEIKLPKLPKGDALRFYDFEKWEALVAGAERSGPMVLVAVLLGGEAGLRRGEIVALEQTNCGATEITVRQTEWQKSAKEKHVGTTKGNSTRRIPMTERLRQAIARVRHLDGKRLLRQENGRKVTLTTLQAWLETACRRAGLPKSRDIHKLRHTFASHCAMRNVPMRTLQEWMGHADLSTTLKYAHLSEMHGAEAIKLLEQRNAPKAHEETS